MECSQNDVINESTPDIVGITGSNSEINLDDVINNNKNETDIFSDLLTAISESLNDVSVNTALTFESVEQSLNAYASPSLNTRVSMSSASESSEMYDPEEYKPPFDVFYRATSPLQVWRNDKGRITGFEMMCDDQKVKVVDSLECLADHPLEAVYFDPRVYLGIPYREQEFEGFSELSEKYEEEDEKEDDDVKTAVLGPTFEEFEDWLRDND